MDASGKNAPGLSRRELITLLGRFGLGSALSPWAVRLLGAAGLINAGDDALAGVSANQANPANSPGVPGAAHPAAYWHAEGPAAMVRCELCPRRELLAPGQTGLCRARQNIAGALVTQAYGRPCVVNIDPIGKNPLAHFLPGANVLSLAHAGCNLRCQYCQNWQYSQKAPGETANIAGFAFDEAVARLKSKGIAAVSFTYTEAAATPEFAGDFAAYCGERGLKRTLCSAGYIEKKPLSDLLRHFDAVTVTYKGPSEDFYRNVVGGELRPVQDAMAAIRTAGKWLEIATLIVPTLNDNLGDLGKMAKWIAANLGADTPWHLERFDPQYKLANLPPTPQKTMEAARAAGQDAGLRYVYISNVSPHPGNNTYCPHCGLELIHRLGFVVTQNALAQGACPRCRTRIAGVFA